MHAVGASVSLTGARAEHQISATGYVCGGKGG